MEKYDLIIVGAGPAGIFTAVELLRRGSKKHILLVEKGKPVEKRHCPKAEIGHCVNCRPTCAITTGFSGAGAFSDGKLSLSYEVGGDLPTLIGEEFAQELIDYTDKIYLEFGADPHVEGIYTGEDIKEIRKNAIHAGLKLVDCPIRHLGTDVNGEILTHMRDSFPSHVTVKANCPVDHILVKDGKVEGVIAGGETYLCKYLVAAPGRDGAEWFTKEAESLGLHTASNAVDIGVRVESPAEIYEPITDICYESKLVYFSKSFDDRVRTFCMNPYGFVVTENNNGLMTVNGHSYAHKKSGNTNFAILVSKQFTQPFHEPIEYGKYIASLANMLGGGPIVQRLGDLRDGRRSTAERIRRGLVHPTMPSATPGDLSLVLPYRFLKDIMEMFEALDKVAPGANSRHTLLYGVEVKFYSSRIELSNQLETKIPNFFAIGDGAGITRGLAQASAAGVVVGREICARIGKPKGEI